MAGYDDDDDWVGEPPEGRISRDRARPEFWAGQRPVTFVGVGIVLVVVIIVIVAVVS